MPSAELTGPSDDFWLTAHDGVNNSRVIGDRPLGIGLATGLLAALVRGEWCRLWDGELYRTTADPPSDIALRTLLSQMEEDEKEWPLRPALVALTPQTYATPPAQTYVAAHAWQPPERVRPPEQVWPPETRAAGDPSPAAQETRPAGRGHRVRDWIAFLANKERALTLVGDRLVASGLAWREERGRVFRKVRYMPRDMTVTGNPASKIRTHVKAGIGLPWPGLMLAGLFLATGLDQHALALMKPSDLAALRCLLKGLDAESRELLLAAHNAVGDAAAIR